MFKCIFLCVYFVFYLYIYIYIFQLIISEKFIIKESILIDTIPGIHEIGNLKPLLVIHTQIEFAYIN